MRKGYIYSILSAVLFGSAGLIVKFAFNQGIDSVDLLTLQYIIAVTLMMLIILLTNKKALAINRIQLLHTAVLGIIGNTFMTVFYYMAFSRLQVAMVAILLYTYPIMVFLYSAIFQKTSITFRKVTALLMAFSGCFLALKLTNGVGGISRTGLICGLLSAVFYAFMNLYSEKKLNNVNSITINFYSTAFSLLSLMVYRFPAFIFRGSVNINLIGSTAVLAVICEIIPLTLLYAAIKEIGAFKVSIIGNLEIPTAMILSFLLLKEPITILQTLGAIMVFYAIYLIKK